MRCKISLLALVILATKFSIPAFGQSGLHNYTVITSGNPRDISVYFTDSIKAVHKTLTLINDYQEEGYINAHYTYSKENHEGIFRIDKGKRYQWAFLKEGNLPLAYKGRFGFEKNFGTDKPFSYNQLLKLFRGIITQAENEGRPFASIRLDSIKIINENISAVLNFNRGPFITYDSLGLMSYNSINKKWLASYLNVQQGTPFQEKAYKNITAGIGQLEFLKINQEPQLTFQNDEATIILDLNYVKANQLDVIIGFAPGAGNNNKLLITGEADLILVNLFQRGHKLKFGWRSIKPATQQLDLYYHMPNLFNSPINILGEIGMYKQDSNYLNYNLLAEISFRKNDWNLGAYSKLFRSSVQDRDIVEAKDVKVNYVGFKAALHEVKKHEIEIEMMAGVGNKNVEVADGPPETVQVEVKLQSILKRNFDGAYLRIQPDVHFLINENLYTNELLRIGGIRSLRGFPENFFFVENYTLLKNEYHWVMDDGSSFFAMADLAYIGHENIDYAYGLGMGFDLKVNSGIFELIYAVGGHEQQNLSFDQSIIHFGYRAVF